MTKINLNERIGRMPAMSMEPPKFESNLNGTLYQLRRFDGVVAEASTQSLTHVGSRRDAVTNMTEVTSEVETVKKIWLKMGDGKEKEFDLSEAPDAFGARASHRLRIVTVQAGSNTAVLRSMDNLTSGERYENRDWASRLGLGSGFMDFARLFVPIVLLFVVYLNVVDGHLMYAYGFRLSEFGGTFAIAAFVTIIPTLILFALVSALGWTRGARHKAQVVRELAPVLDKLAKE
ncbi:hypothetical protein [Roseateles violae]|uniref:Uncharacterized protein n=1 Tax=Roseateles violae TaxID=3058042 RepID=A0ABT8DNV5_9BURK|nr:hypothetical protein [Pelomonas sp. PFR6]MDN3920045.1 hypothetical protein [Pelomonas sp. PFR6]